MLALNSYGYKSTTNKYKSTTKNTQINIKINSIKKYLRKNKNNFAKCFLIINFTFY